MDWLLAWDHFVFVIPILIGTMFAAGSMFGLHGHGHHAHGHAGSRSFLGRAGGFLGLGKAPMATMMMVMAYAFGIPGLGVTMLFEHAPGRGVFGLAAGTAGFFVITPLLARTMARLLPSTETEAIGLRSLLGDLAYATFDTSEGMCHAIVKGNGSDYQVEVKVTDSVKKGDAIVLTGFDADIKQFTGSPAPKPS